MAPLRHAIGDKWLVSWCCWFRLSGRAGEACVAGTTARASSENVRSLGYSIYYTLVNIGGAVGPLMAGWSARRWDGESRMFSRRGAERVSDVLGDAFFLP